MNPDKSEIIIGTSASQRSEPLIDNFKVAGISVPVSRTVRSLGVTLDNTPSFDDYIDDVCIAAHHITFADRCLSLNDTKAVTVAMVLSQLDYCNSVLCGLRNVFVEPQQVATHPECLGVYCHDHK